MSSSTAYSERFSASLHKEQAQRQYGDRCGRSRPPSRSDGGAPAASSYGERAETQCKPLKNALGRNIVIVGAQWGDEAKAKWSIGSPSARMAWCVFRAAITPDTPYGLRAAKGFSGYFLTASCIRRSNAIS